MIGLAFDILLETGVDLSVKVLSNQDQARKSFSFLGSSLFSVGESRKLEVFVSLYRGSLKLLYSPQRHKGTKTILII